jgi:predicted peptidase
MKVRIDKHKQLHILVVEPPDNDKGSPVLLFLHGRGEASTSINELPLVFVHHSPPFQAIMGRLKDVTVVAPQAPHDPDSNWDWSASLEDLHNYLLTHFPQRKILATGFSRGELGVLQLLQSFPQTVSKWAVVDPQPGSDSLFKGIPLPAVGLRTDLSSHRFSLSRSSFLNV